jgi:hypothetical protein
VRTHLWKRATMVLMLLCVAVALSITSPFVTVSTAASYTIWPSTATPAVIGDPDTDAVELGAKFQSNSDGFITGIRFYKASTSTGTHVGNLWTRGGTRLATVTFTNETASGWQYQALATPVSITANTTYIVSYHTNVGRYSYDDSYFTTSGYDNWPLRALRDSEDGPNGLYLYGAGGFPNLSWHSRNYWVDVVFEVNLGSDTTAPAVTSVSPISGETGVSTGVQVTATFSEAMSSASISGSTVELRTSTGDLVTTTVSYSSATMTGILAPASSLSNLVTYTVTVRGGSSGVKDIAGNALAADYTWSFTTAAAENPQSLSIWGDSVVPSISAADDASAVELGVKLRSYSDGFIQGIRFYKASTNTGTHVGNLWTSGGTRLATATFTNETSSGWQYQSLGTPAPITANTTYIVSYHTNVGCYSFDDRYFSTSGYDNGTLRALRDGEDGSNGVYRYGSIAFPNLSWQSRNYWVDVVFSPTISSDTTAPIVDLFSIPAAATSLTVSITTFTATDNVGVTGYMVTESSSAPLATATGWSATALTSHTFTSAGSKTLYAWAKDDAGNVSSSKSAAVTITLPGDTTPPTVTFTLPGTASTLTVTFTQFTATDGVGVTGYMVTESSTAPLATSTGWLTTAPTSYTFTSAGTKTLYAWAKDGAGNVSSSKSATVTITLPADTTRPTVTFTLPATASTLTVTFTQFTATDNVGVTGYMVKTSSTNPLATSTGWSTTAPTSYTFTSTGSKTLYAWAKDAAGNVSTRKSASVTITLSTDTTPPTVTLFSVPATATTLIVSITGFTATDNVGVTGYMVTESSSAPLATATGWSATAPTSYTFTSTGTKSLYAWAKDAAGNVSPSKNASVTITLQTNGPEPAGWYAGDMHVHRSCGGEPESISSIYNKMSTHNLAVVSLLADMGNGEVLYPEVDLPRVNGSDDPISTTGRIVHWDAEWHWDPVYNQYPQQALGGHVVVLGVSGAEQIWEEYTYRIFEWAHQQNGIAGFAHMQHLNGGIPQSLTCCIPIEYPVEVALGSADFISEDVFGSDSFIDAYYKLLNCGFRPGFAAGTDYPCGVSELGSPLTYVRVEDGQMSYRNWIEGIAAGRTVVSRNGHNEFLNLKVNGSSMPGDTINFAGNGSVTVTIEWTAKQNLTGTIELVKSGEVVASRQASVGAGVPASLSASVEFTKSGWLAARRMGTSETVVNTAAVFVIIDNAPIRASESDALFYVEWMDNLLQKTAQGGQWSSYFEYQGDEARARYQAAKALFEQIASEAAEPPGEPPTGLTIFTSQLPTSYENDSTYELGTKFWTDVDGQITGVRLYTHVSEGGNHTVRIWRAADGVLVSGPHTWSISSGSAGWKTFALPTALNIISNTDYIVAISNSSDRYYTETPYGFDAPIINGHLRTYSGSGLYAVTLGSMPTSSWQNTNYFRDVLFVPSQ